LGVPELPEFFGMAKDTPFYAWDGALF
jgi:hypothetical protein